MVKQIDKELILGVDIGGSHVSAALVSIADGAIQEESFCKEHVDAQGNSEVILDQLLKAFEFSLSKVSSSCIKGVGISMPGPFDYLNGISLIRGGNKYEELYGLNIKEVLKTKLGFPGDLPIHFENDAVCFGLGESLTGEAARCSKVIAITLGTGFGATFLDMGKVQKEGPGVPPEGYLYNTPFRGGIAEDYISTKWLVSQYNQLTGSSVSQAKEIYELALNENDTLAIDVFRTFGQNLGACLGPWIRRFEAECLIIGGNLTKASTFFLPELELVFKQNNLTPFIQLSEETELAAIVGAATLVQRSKNSEKEKAKVIKAFIK